jgi:hypothetical protein
MRFLTSASVGIVPRFGGGGWPFGSRPVAMYASMP